MGRSTRSAHNKVVSRSLPLKIDTTPSGPVDQPSHLSQPSKASGSPKKSTRRTVPRSSTESACEPLQTNSQPTCKRSFTGRNALREMFELKQLNKYSYN